MRSPSEGRTPPCSPGRTSRGAVRSAYSRAGAPRWRHADRTGDGDVLPRRRRHHDHAQGGRRPAGRHRPHAYWSSRPAPGLGLLPRLRVARVQPLEPSGRPGPRGARGVRARPGARRLARDRRPQGAQARAPRSACRRSSSSRRRSSTWPPTTGGPRSPTAPTGRSSPRAGWRARLAELGVDAALWHAGRRHRRVRTRRCATPGCTTRGRARGRPRRPGRRRLRRRPAQAGTAYAASPSWRRSPASGWW